MTERNKDQSQSIVVKMPSAKELTKKLTDSNILGMTPQSDRFFNKFISNVADSEKVGEGLAMAWTSAMYDTLSDLPPQVQGIMNTYFDKVIDIVTPNTEVASQAKSFMNEVLQESRNK